MKKIGKKPIGLASIVLIAVLSGLMAIMFSGGSGGVSRFVVYAAGTPDAYGDRIYAFAALQNTTGTWTIIASVGYAAYTPGYSLSIPANQKTILSVTVALNQSFAPDLSTASTRARVYLNVSGVTTNSLMIYALGWQETGIWVLRYDYPATTLNPTSVWVPTTDTTYTITAQYQAYY